MNQRRVAVSTVKTGVLLAAEGSMFGESDPMIRLFRSGGACVE